METQTVGLAIVSRLTVFWPFDDNASSACNSWIESMPVRSTRILLTLVFLAGCGSSQYEEKFETSLETLRNETPFSSLWPQPISIPGLVEGENIILKVRIPRVFDTKTEEAYVLDQNTPSPRNPEVAVTADRLWPTFLRVGTHLRTYEVTLNFRNVAGQNVRSSIRCFLAVMPRSKEVDAQGVLSKRITDKLKQAFNENTVLISRQKQSHPQLKSGVGGWLALQVPMPNGKTREIKKIEANGNIQLPYYMEPGKPAIQNKTRLATCLVYIIRSGEETVILSWLLPADLVALKNIAVQAVKVPVAQLPVARAMAGTIQVTQVTTLSTDATEKGN